MVLPRNNDVVNPKTVLVLIDGPFNKMYVTYVATSIAEMFNVLNALS